MGLFQIAQVGWKLWAVLVGLRTSLCPLFLKKTREVHQSHRCPPSRWWPNPPTHRISSVSWVNIFKWTLTFIYTHRVNNPSKGMYGELKYFIKPFTRLETSSTFLNSHHKILQKIQFFEFQLVERSFRSIECSFQSIEQESNRDRTI